MSKHSIGAYMELWREVGVSFEAILAAESGVISQRESQESSDAKVSFAVRIEGLQTENTELNN